MTNLEATDAALELAEERGIELENVTPTGVDGKILKSDVKAYIEEQVAGAELPEEFGRDFHTVVRGISKTGRLIQASMGSYFPVEQVDGYIRSWMEEGYEVQEVFYLGEVPEGYNMMYILVR